MFGILYSWAINGEGSFSTAISSKTSCTGAFLARSFCWSLLQYSKIWVKLTPVFCINGTVIPQLWYADPKATVPLATSTCQSDLCCSGAKVLIRSLTFFICSWNLAIMSSGVTWSSLISRSTLLMNKTGRTFSFSAWRTTVSVCGIAPSTAQVRIMHPSTALIARVTSPPKSTCPGVSIRLIR